MRRAAVLLPLILLAFTSQAARVTVGTASGSAGGTAAVSITFASEGASVASFAVDLGFTAPLSYSSISTGAAATGAGKMATASPITGGVKLIVYGLNQTQMPDGAVATITFAIASGTGTGTYPVTAANGQASDPSANLVALSTTSGSVTVGTSQPPAATWIIPSSAHVSGAGAFWTTDLFVANTGTANGQFTLRFLGHDADGRNGQTVSFPIDAGKTTVVSDVLLSQFAQNPGYGGIQVTSTVTTLAISAQTSTPGPSPPGGTYGQSIPAAGPSQLVAQGSPRSIVGIREDASFRTNLILTNAGQALCDVDVTLFLGNGTNAMTKRYKLDPLGMHQASYVVRDMGVTANVSGARVVIAPVTAGCSIATYASVISTPTGDPKSLLPQ